MIERQVIVTWYTPEEKLPPVGQIVVASISGFTKHTTYDHTFALVEAISDAYDMAIKALEATSPCDLCVKNPPSSMDGKPCSYCPAEPYREDI